MTTAIPVSGHSGLHSEFNEDRQLCWSVWMNQRGCRTWSYCLPQKAKQDKMAGKIVWQRTMDDTYWTAKIRRLPQAMWTSHTSCHWPRKVGCLKQKRQEGCTWHVKHWRLCHIVCCLWSTSHMAPRIHPANQSCNIFKTSMPLMCMITIPASSWNDLLPEKRPRLMKVFANNLHTRSGRSPYNP